MEVTRRDAIKTAASLCLTAAVPIRTFATVVKPTRSYRNLPLHAKAIAEHAAILLESQIQHEVSYEWCCGLYREDARHDVLVDIEEPFEFHNVNFTLDERDIEYWSNIRNFHDCYLYPAVLTWSKNILDHAQFITFLSMKLNRNQASVVRNGIAVRATLNTEVERKCRIDIDTLIAVERKPGWMPPIVGRSSNGLALLPQSVQSQL